MECKIGHSKIKTLNSSLGPLISNSTGRIMKARNWMLQGFEGRTRKPLDRGASRDDNRDPLPHFLKP